MILEQFLRQSAARLARSALWLVLFFLACVPSVQSAQQPKNITGQVSDLRGRPLTGANVFVRNVDTGVVRIHRTDDRGIYAVYGLPPDVDFEVYAEFEGEESEKRVISRFLNREDSVLNFEMYVAIIEESESVLPDSGGLVLESFDRVQLRADFEYPDGIPAPIPAALLLHGYGESRSVWKGLAERLLIEGWAVMSLDLRGHGQSRLKNGQRVSSQEGWRGDPQQFPLDLEPALDWLKSQARLDTSRISVIGTDVGANLALIAASRFPEVPTAIAINPVLDETLQMAGTARGFSPKTAHLIVSDREAARGIREFVAGASRITVAEAAGGTEVWLGSTGVVDEIVRWLQDTY